MKGLNLEEWVELRRKAREDKDWSLSDTIRYYLDNKGCFVFDTKEGQEVYYTNGKTREQLVNEINQDKRADKLLDAWIFSHKKRGNN